MIQYLPREKYPDNYRQDRGKVFANRVAKYWNKLPEDLRVIGEDETLILGFKRQLEKYKMENIDKKITTGNLVTKFTPD